MPNKTTVFESTFTRHTSSEIIGQGGTGRIYKGVSDAEDVVAIKLLDPDKGSARDRRRRFKNELLFGTRHRHPNVVTVLDHGLHQVGRESTPFYVMPLYSGSLRDAIAVGVPHQDVLRQFAQILDGVEAAHLQSVVHRDLKPENILYDSSPNRWVVADFGIAEFTQEDLYTLVETRPNTRLANFQYAAPEQRPEAGIPTDVRTFSRWALS